ncbi:MAG: type IV pilus modification PilV family protein [Myxococcota bacterium]
MSTRLAANSYRRRREISSSPASLCPLRQPGPRSEARGFTLLEVMIAIALLAMGLVLLLSVQARSIQLAQQARNLSGATGLARAKMYDCTRDLLKKGFSIGNYDEEGDFDDEEMPGFYWECHAYKPDIPVSDVTDVTAGLSAAAGGEGAAGGMSGAADAAGIGAGMIAPVLSQISSVLGDSIRELVVIVRWREGEAWEQLEVTTHVVDKTQINAIASQLQTMSGQMGGMLGGALGAGGGAPASGGSDFSAGSRPEQATGGGRR